MTNTDLMDWFVELFESQGFDASWEFRKNDIDGAKFKTYYVMVKYINEDLNLRYGQGIHICETYLQALKEPRWVLSELAESVLKSMLNKIEEDRLAYEENRISQND